MTPVFYEIGRVIGEQSGFRVSKHTCERGSVQHRQGDIGEEIAFFDGPDAEIKARALLAALSDDKETP